MKKYLLTTLALGLVASNLNADCVKMNRGGLCESVKVERLYVNAGTTYVATTGVEANIAEACHPVANVYLALKKTNPNYDNMHKTLLGAQNHKNTVMVRVVADANDNCEVAYVVSETNFNNSSYEAENSDNPN